MASITANETHASSTCCSAAVPTASVHYSPKGQYLEVSQTTCYLTGPQDANKAVFFLYDIFGFRAPTIQGADILASTGHLVIMPDLFDGEPAEPEWMGLSDEEKKPLLGKWMAKISDAKPHIERIMSILAAAKTQYPSVKSWGSIGFCWGGKLVSVTSGADTPWSASIQSSPARIDAADGEKVVIPMMVLASKDEPADGVAAFAKSLKVPNVVETFHDQVHGWMSARAELENDDVKKQYERGYQLSLDWFQKHL